MSQSHQILSSDAVGPSLLQVLGIPADRVIEATIVLRSGEPILVEVVRYAESDSGALDFEPLTKIVSRYRLISDERVPTDARK